MPYFQGTATSADDLRAAIVSFAQTNGWTWDAANLVLAKGPIFTKLELQGTAPSQSLSCMGALGYSGPTLTSPAPIYGRIGTMYGGGGNMALTWPVTVHIFIHNNPDSIFVAINYHIEYWQWMSFGLGNSLLNDSLPLYQISSNIIAPVMIYWNPNSNINPNVPFIPFVPMQYGNTNYCNAVCYRPLTGNGGAGWSLPPVGSSFVANNIGVDLRFARYQPQAWNMETVLSHFTPTLYTTTSTYAPLMQLPHIRICRNDFINDGSILDQGTKKWFVMPMYRKNINARNGDSSNPASTTTANHSGTFAFAIKYDGA